VRPVRPTQKAQTLAHRINAGRESVACTGGKRKALFDIDSVADCIAVHVGSEDRTRHDSTAQKPHPVIIDAALDDNGRRWVQLSCPYCNANAKSTAAGLRFFDGIRGFWGHLNRAHPEYDFEEADVRQKCYLRDVPDEEAEAIKLDYRAGRDSKSHWPGLQPESVTEHEQA